MKDWIRTIWGLIAGFVLSAVVAFIGTPLVFMLVVAIATAGKSGPNDGELFAAGVYSLVAIPVVFLVGIFATVLIWLAHRPTDEKSL